MGIAWTDWFDGGRFFLEDRAVGRTTRSEEMPRRETSPEHSKDSISPVHTIRYTPHLSRPRSTALTDIDDTGQRYQPVDPPSADSSPAVLNRAEFWPCPTRPVAREGGATNLGKSKIRGNPSTSCEHRASTMLHDTLPK